MKRWLRSLLEVSFMACVFSTAGTIGWAFAEDRFSLVIGFGIVLILEVATLFWWIDGRTPKR